MDKFDVTIDRDKFIGGSDIPAIMGISPFKKRFDLLLEKAGLAESDFNGNIYTEYGNVLEPKIRDYVNLKYGTNYKPSQTIKGDLRANTDGLDDFSVLEIKTTSKIHDNVDDYKVYLVQLIFYMAINERENGLLCVYNRPADFNEEFNSERLQEFTVYLNDYKELLIEINAAIDRFRADLQRLKENPLLSEEDLQPTALIELSNKVITLENQMSAFKKLETEYKEMKQALYKAMCDYNVKTWEMPNGTKITRVDGTPASVKTVEEFDVASFKKDNPEQYKAYTKEVIKTTNGKSGYALITFPKEKS